MNDQQNDAGGRARRSGRPPPFFTRKRIGYRYRERIVEDELRRLERHFVVPPISAVFLLVPDPTQRAASS
jgi:hypothetical protein